MAFVSQVVFSQQHPSKPVQSTDRSLCPPPPCTRVGSAPQQAPRTETLRTACRLDVTAFQVTRTVLWPRQDTPTLSTPASPTASHHRCVSTWILNIQHRNIPNHLQTLTFKYTYIKSVWIKHTYLSTHIHYHTKNQNTSGYNTWCLRITSYERS